MNTSVCRLIGYIRVSREDQVDSGLGLEAQRRKLQLAAELKGCQLVGIEEDLAVSGAVVKRPGLERAIARVAAGEAGGLIVAKLDRLGRSARHICELIERFNRAKWPLIALDIGLDTSTEVGTFVAQIMGAVAQLERSRTSVRIREALAVAKSQGTRLGCVTWKNPRMVTPELAGRVAGLYREHGSYRRVARLLNEQEVAPPRGARWYPSSVRATCLRAGPVAENPAA